jgi:hypothetical protein
MTLTAPARITASLVTVLVGTLAAAPHAVAGSYYVYGCSSYGNTASAFAPFSNADHLNTPDECMQPAPGGGYRSLEIDNAPGGQAPVLHGYGANWTASSPSPAISIVGAYTPLNTVFVDCNLHADGFTAEYLWSSGSQAIDHVNGCNSYGYGYGTGINVSFNPSSYFGWGAGCWLASSCSTSSSIGAVLGVQGVRLTVEEDSGPSVVADGSNNLWYQAGGWVRGGGWPVTFTASDPSGVCGTVLAINGSWTSTDYTSDANPDSSSFTQCWPTDTPTGTFDTRTYGDASVSIDYAAANAAGVWATPTETIRIDNTPVTLSLSTPDDNDTNAWVDHAVKVSAVPSAGPSGLRGISCSTNRGVSYAYPAGGISLNGTGVWTVACSAQNNAVDVNGQLGSSAIQSVTVHIDESPPAVVFEPVSPSDPQAVVADTSDGQSGVARGQIQMRPAGGGSWQSLGTQFDGSHLLARFDDATLAPGKWVVEASSCDNAGNCTSADETLTLPIRTASVSSVSFAKVQAVLAARVVRERVRVGWHWATVRRHGRLERVKRGGRFESVQLIKYKRRCSNSRIKIGRHRWRDTRRCRRPRLGLKSRERAPFGSAVVVHGLLTTVDGLPIANARVDLMTAPDNGLSEYSRAGTVTTGANGSWTVTLPAGPSRLIAAAYGGSGTIQPSEGWARLIVPARVKVLRVWPRDIPWGGKVHIRAQLLGGFLPSGGALVRLRLGAGNARITYGVQAHVGGNGTFEVTNAFGPGPATVTRHYWLQECTLPEGDYPFAPACGPRSDVTVGGPAP